MSDIVKLDIPQAKAKAAAAQLTLSQRATVAVGSAFNRLSALVGVDGGMRGLWGTRSYGPDNQLRTYQRDLNRVREQVATNPLARNAVKVRVDNLIGSWGFEPKIDHLPAVKRLWNDWWGSRECDANGMHTGLGLTRQALEAVETDGECVLRIRDRDPANRIDMAMFPMSGVGMQIQLMEIDHLDIDRTREEPDGTVTTAGVNRSQYNNAVLGYWLKPRHPQALLAVPLSNTTNEAVWIPARDVLRLRKVDRIGTPRSSPPLRVILGTLKDRRDWMDAAIVKAGVAARRVYWVSPPGLPDDKQVLKQLLGGISAEALIEGQNASGEYVISLPENGEITMLPPGWKVEDSKPAELGDLTGFCQIVGQEIAAGTGIPYAIVTQDVAAVNERLARWMDIQFERSLEFDQEEIVVRQFLAPIWRRFIARVFFVDCLLDPADYDIESLLRIDWRYPRRKYVNRAQEAEADAKKIESGTISRTEIIESEGGDAARTAFELAVEAKTADLIENDPEIKARIEEVARQRALAQLGG